MRDVKAGVKFEKVVQGIFRTFLINVLNLVIILYPATFKGWRFIGLPCCPCPERFGPVDRRSFVEGRLPIVISNKLKL